MEILKGVSVPIYFDSVSAKAVSVRQHMIIALVTNYLSPFIPGQNEEQDTVDEPRLESTAHGNGPGLEKIP